MYGSMEESPAAAPALAPAELKAVRKLLSTTSSSIGGSDVTDQPGLLHEPQELSTSALAKLEAASDEVEFQQSIWDASLFLFNPVAGRGGNALVDVVVRKGLLDQTIDQVKGEGALQKYVDGQKHEREQRRAAPDHWIEQE